MAYRNSRPQVRARKKADVPVDQGGGGLAPQAPPQQLAALTFEHGRLLKAIADKKNEHARFDRDLHNTASGLLGVEPIREETLAVERQIHRLFRDLMARKGQNRKARRAIGLVYEMLQDQGVLSPEDQDRPGDLDDSRENDPGDQPFDAQHGRGDSAPGWGHGGRHPAPPPPPGAGGFSARRPSDAEGDRSLRGLFRRLAMAMHPDRVADAAEKVRRTEAMKEITRAYEERDLARLLHLEQTWMNAGVLDAEGTPDDSLARKVAHLERMNQDLRAQLRALAQALRELRRSPAGALHLELRREAQRAQRHAGRSSRSVDPVAALMAEAKMALCSLQDLRAFVMAFRDGNLTLDAFMRGPAGGASGIGRSGAAHGEARPSNPRRGARSRPDDDSSDDPDDDEMARLIQERLMQEMLAEMMGFATPPPTRARRNPRKQRQRNPRPDAPPTERTP